jgi:hypothetical protein
LGDFLEIGIHPFDEQEELPNLVEFTKLGTIRVNPIQFYGMISNINTIQ